MIRPLIGLIACCLLGVTAFAEEPDHPLVDRIVAVVNSNVITLSELNNRTDLIASQLGKQGVQLPDRSILMHQVLDKMINDDVQLQYAKDAGIRIDDTQLDLAMDRLSQENKVSLSAFRAEVEREGVTWPQFREEIRNEIVLAQLREREVDNKVFISDGEVNAMITAEDAQGQGGDDEYDVAHLLITVPDNAPPAVVEQRRQKMVEALDQIQHGMPFSQAVTAYSEAPDALQGGDLGWRPAARLPSLFIEAAKTLQPGQHSEILRSQNGFHLIELIGRRHPSQKVASVNQFHARQILIKIPPGMDPQDAKNKIDGLYGRIQGGEDFSKLATLNSEDESRNRGGDLGWISEGATLPEFEKVLKSLQPEQVSQPFETPLGWHLVQLLGVRQTDSSSDGRRLAIRQALHARKADEAYDDWIHQLRDQAYIDVRLDDTH